MWQRANRIRDWNAQVIRDLPLITEEIERINPDIASYLKGRNRVFTDFQIGAEKVSSAILRAGPGLLLIPAMSFQLTKELDRLEWLTLHEVEELADFLDELITAFPHTASMFHTVRSTLRRLQREIRSQGIQT